MERESWQQVTFLAINQKARTNKFGEQIEAGSRLLFHNLNFETVVVPKQEKQNE